MRIGVKYESYDHASALLWCLHDARVVTEYSQFGAPREGSQEYVTQEVTSDEKTFCCEINGNTFFFSKNYDRLAAAECDMKINIVSEEPNGTDPRFNTELCIFPDIIRSTLSDDSLLDYMDRGNICFSASTVDFEHKNFIFCPLFGVIFFYYRLGLNYNNYYQAPKLCKHLVGMYHRVAHVGGGIHPTRNYIYERSAQILGPELSIFNRPKTDMASLLESYRYFGLWMLNHSVSYTDYATCVCNIIYETFDDEDTWVALNRTTLTEKTTKAIIFSEEKIFFIWYGPKHFARHLIDYGFWCLNFEFLNTSQSPIRNIKESVFYAISYLKSLKADLGSNVAVYGYLLGKYGDKLRENARLFKQLEDQCPQKDAFLELITNG